jgi:hypothetical protein
MTKNAGSVEFVPIGQAIKYAVQKSRELPGRIEFMGYATGTTDEVLDRVSFPSVLGINSCRRDLLDDLIRVSGQTDVHLTLHPRHDNGDALGIRLRYTEPGRDKENQEFFRVTSLVTPIAKGLAGYLPSALRDECFCGMAPGEINNHMLEALIRDRGLPTTLNDHRCLYLPAPLEVGQFGTEHSYYVSKHNAERTLGSKTGSQ